MKHTWWNWHAVLGTAYWNMGHTAGTLRKIGIYFILRNNWHIDVPWNISKIFYWITLFCVQHMVFNIELYDILYSILCKLYILRIGVLDWHITLCKGLIWNYKNCWAQPWLSFGILQAFQWSSECISYFFLTDTGFYGGLFRTWWKKYYFANPPGRNTSPPGQISYSARADCSIFRPGWLQHIPPGRITIPPGRITIPPRRNSYDSARAD